MKNVEPIIYRQGRTLTPGERIEVYYNIHQGGFSIKSLDKRNPAKGKVVAYAAQVCITGATFHLSEPTLAKIRESNVKNVYAVVRGIYQHHDVMDNSTHRLGYCNPYTTGKFIDWDTKEQLHAASEVYFYDKYFSYEGV